MEGQEDGKPTSLIASPFRTPPNDGSQPCVRAGTDWKAVRLFLFIFYMLFLFHGLIQKYRKSFLLQSFHQTRPIPHVTLFPFSLGFQVPPVPHGWRLRRQCSPFLPCYPLRTSHRQWHGSGVAGRKKCVTPAWKYSGRRLRITHFPCVTPFTDFTRWRQSALSEVGTIWKAPRPTTFCVLFITRVLRARRRELSAFGQALQEYAGSGGQMRKSICRPFPAHTCHCPCRPCFSMSR